MQARQIGRQGTKCGWVNEIVLLFLFSPFIFSYDFTRENISFRMFSFHCNKSLQKIACLVSKWIELEWKKKVEI